MAAELELFWTLVVVSSKRRCLAYDVADLRTHRASVAGDSACIEWTIILHPSPQPSNIILLNIPII